MKKSYQTPTVMVWALKPTSMICSSVTDVDGGNTEIGYGGPGDGTPEHGGAPRVKANTATGDWDGWDNWDHTSGKE